MEETKQQPLALRACAELAGSFLLCFAIYAFSTWGSAVYGVNVVFTPLATALAYAVVTAIFGKVSGGQLNPAVTVAAVLVSKTKLVDGILYVVIGALLIVAAAVSTMGEHGESSDRHVATMGLAYGLATAISYPVTGAGMNPARSTGIALATMNQGLDQNPVQQLWVFWIAPVLAAAVVALVVIIAQMATAPKAKTIEPVDAEQVDTETDVDAESAEQETAEGAEEAEVGEQQADSEGNADEGVERH